MKAIFLDRDGVINRKKENGYITGWDEFFFLPSVFKGLKIFSDCGYELFIITNQQGIGKQLFTVRDLEKIHDNMKAALSEKGIKIKKIYFCPHREIDLCDCRKPATGMVRKAIEEFPDLDIKKSFLIGDSITDIEMGHRIGIKTVFIFPRAGTRGKDCHGTASDDGPGKSLNNTIKPDYIKKDLLEAAELIANS